MSPKDTIQKNLDRVKTLVDDVVLTSEQGFPLFGWLELSPIEMCNRACVFCPRSDPNSLPNQNLSMPAVLYTKLADELAALEYQGTVMLAGYGEPMMHRQINQVVECFARVSNTEITTNGDFLKPKTIEQLMRAGIGKIVVSLYDGPHQIEEFTRMFESVSVPADRYILRDRWYGADQDFGVKLTNRAGTVHIGNQPEFCATRPCYYPHYMMMIDWNGDVFLCTQDWQRKIKSGNVMLASLLEVWTSPMFKRYRTHLREGRRDLFPCNGCNADGTLHGANQAALWSQWYGQDR